MYAIRSYYDHGGGYYSFYAYLSEATVKKGDTVSYNFV